MTYRVSGEQAVAALVGIALAHEVLADRGQLLSNAYDRWLEKYPIVTWTVTTVTVLHLLNVLPPTIDPYARIGTKKKEETLYDRI